MKLMLPSARLRNWKKVTCWHMQIWPGPEPRTSTPNVSCAPHCDSASSMPNISLIDRCSSAPILVSDASIADLESHLQKHTTSFKKEKPNNTTFCTPGGSLKTSHCNDSKNSSCQASPRQCTLQESTRICPRQETLQACPQQVSPRHCSRQEHSGYPSRRSACHKSTDSSRCCGGGAHKRGEIKFARLELCPDNKTQKTKKHGKFDCDCVEELYFNDETKKSCGSSPRSCCTERSDGARCKLTPSEFFAQLRKGLKCHSPTKMKKDSGATCSLVDSSTATCDASFYHNKLLATLQILQNKEETIGVQAESLAVAEERIATLTERANELKRELDRKTKEYQTLRKIGECCKVAQNDACVLTDKPMEDQKAIVTTLENNLSVIEELYRECFYEDIASEVDGLKTEISNFLNTTTSTSTNQDSGMWERSEDSLTSVPAVQDDLQEVTEQLLRLQDLLAIKMDELQQKLSGLEGLAQIREQLVRSQEDTCDAMTMQLQRTKALLDEKIELISQLKQENEAQAEKIQQLQEELDKADGIIKENCKMRSEVTYLSAQVELWRAQLQDSQRRVAALDQDLARTRAHTHEIDACYREQEALLKERDALLEMLHRRLEQTQGGAQYICSTCERLAPCSKCLSSRGEASFTSKLSPRRESCRNTSSSEEPSCSTTPTLRVLRNKEAATKRCKAWMCEAGMQLPERRESGNDPAPPAPPRPSCCGLRPPRHVRLSRASVQLQPGAGPSTCRAPPSPCRAPIQLQAVGPSASCTHELEPCAGPRQEIYSFRFLIVTAEQSIKIKQFDKTCQLCENRPIVLYKPSNDTVGSIFSPYPRGQKNTC
ncbi:hypothetical protein HW555_011870 [Spodoptera exigua]|uniref:Uncharacterized protein n=1 Tax=Spodoptera exigua TaxID=7107 RepID=A0A835L462_SPOEX|nr:hypothetical protein HW555_011870 [Spodoptera exigua]